MAWAEKLPSGRWRGKYRDATGRSRSAGLWDTKRRASNEASAKERDARLSVTPVDAETITWGQWEPRWWASRRVAASTLATDASRVARYVRPRWSGVRLVDVTPHDVQTWASGLPGSPSTVRNIANLFSNSMRAAIAARIIPTSPCVGLVLPKVTRNTERVVTDEELATIEWGLSPHDQLTIALLLGTGLRLGEAQGLHWDHVDLLRRTVTVRWAWSEKGHRFKAPKSYAQRTVPLPRELADRLREVLDTRGPGLPPDRDYDGTAPVRGLVVLPVAGGAGPADSWSLRDRWALAVRLGGVEHARLHDLRHTYASQLVSSGVPLHVVQHMLGHQSVTTTERYAHLAANAHDVVRSVLDAPRLPHAAPVGMRRGQRNAW